ncbi:hypothetical protein C2845_PM01G15000 [Panicum miliaceum]|uniref:Uncharacterized protein n=1 Tax=Panicum miliaceum TaxID=4540 RepID=A0A3L6TKE0_PANMI|nr:hypothetical protein C2845_PM01G15000 [Panicum miliaceum]
MPVPIIQSRSMKRIDESKQHESEKKSDENEFESHCQAAATTTSSTLRAVGKSSTPRALPALLHHHPGFAAGGGPSSLIYGLEELGTPPLSHWCPTRQRRRPGLIAVAAVPWRSGSLRPCGRPSSCAGAEVEEAGAPTPPAAAHHLASTAAATAHHLLDETPERGLRRACVSARCSKSSPVHLILHKFMLFSPFILLFEVLF